MRQIHFSRVVVLLIFFIPASLVAQDNFLKDYAPVAPTPASLGKYGEIPVGYHTGVPDISIPIYTFTEGSVSVPVSLSYHASGIRVQETAGWAGLGWALNAGGVITRTVQGAPDELGNNSQYWGWYKNKGNGWNTGGTCSALQDVANGWVDTEPDIFSFNVGGYTGKFFYDKDTVIRIVPQQDIKIETCNIGTQLFSGWIVTDPQGVRYHFGATNSSMTMSNYVEKSAYSDDPFTTPKNSSWYLSKIESADRKDVIQFTYAEEKYAFWEVSTSPTDGGIINQSNPGNCGGGSVRAPIVARIIGKRVSVITGSNGSILFTGDTANPRTDLSNYNYCGTSACTLNTEALRLKTIEIKDKVNSCVRKFEFTHTYSTSSTPGSPPPSYLPPNGDQTDLKRLVLLSISEQECGTSANAKTHSFEYFDQTSLPRRLSFAQDHWGYNNNKTSNTNLDPGDNYKKTICNTCLGVYAHVCTAPPNKREPVFPAMRNGTLKKITFPTGGSSALEYEAHTIWTTDSSCVEANIDQFSAYGGSSCCYASCSQSFTLRTYSFTQSQLDNGHINIWVDQACAFNTVNLEVYTSYPGIPVASMSSSGYSNLKKIGAYTLLAGVSYTFKLNQSGNAPAYARLYTLTRTVFNANKIVGGLRVKSITTSDGDADNTNNIVKNFEYADPLDPTHSSGKLVHKPLYVGLFTVGCVSPSQPGCSGTNCNTVPLTNENTYFSCPAPAATPELRAVFSYSSLQPMQTTQGSHLGYTAVQVKETNNGRSEYRYNVGQYASGPWTPTGYPFPPAPYEPLLGTLASEARYTESGIIVQSTQYEYLTSSTNVISGREANKVYSSSAVTTRFYNVNTGYALPSRIIEGQYDAVGNVVEKITDIGYTPANGHLQKTTEEVTNSDASVYRTKYKYAKDYPCPSSGACDETNSAANADAKAIFAMRKRNMVAIPIEQTTWLKKTAWGASFRLTGATYFQYDKVNTDYNNLKLKAVYQVRTATPMTTFVESTTSTGGIFSKDANYIQEYNFDFSDTHGRLLSQWKQNDPAKQQYIWSYNNKLPIAKVINAESTEVAFTSFEQADPLFQGNWTLNGAGGGWSNATNDYVTGRTGFNLSQARTITRSVPAGSYIVSCWHKDGSIYVNGNLVSNSTGGQWKFAETKLTLASSGTVTVSSSGSGDWGQFIDELRLYPADALMRSFSFDDRNQLLLSVADENSIPAHHDYDNFQRLQAVRDQDRNIVQTYEYNYQQAGSSLNDIKARTVLKTGQTTVSQVNALTGADILRVFQYLDGLGRPIQTNQVGQSPSSKDIITREEYDVFGRQPKQFIPYTFTSNNGAFRSGAAAEQLSFANTFGAGGYGYSETRFEPSPLNRPLEQGAPGATWRIGVGHTLEYAYRANTSTDAVQDFRNTSTSSFANNLLSVVQQTDENERLTWTFTDKMGRIVLKKQQLNATEYAQTYTVYDDFGRVLCVVPPETTKRMISSGNWDYNNAAYASMIFKYSYDSRGRLVTKTVPSAGATSIAYDKLDRPVLTTDPNGFKIFTRYDILSRPVVTGKYKGTASPGASDPLFETQTSTAPHYYSSTSFPTDNNLDVYKVFYYDDYDLNNDGNIPANESYTNPAESPYETAAFLRTRGKPTATRTGILNNNGSAPSTFLIARSYYDKEYSLIQVNKQNHLGGADITSSAYDFANRATHTRRDHTATPPSGTLKTYTIREEYVYDNAGRLRFTRHKINSNNWTVTAAPLYDEMGRLQDKRLQASNYDGVSAVTLGSSFNYLQSIDYAYNIRSWLTTMNAPSSCSVQGGDQLADLFSMSLDYESTANGATPQYNGNIASMQWRTNISGGCQTQQQYRFSYDYANRLTAANHYTHNGAAWANTNNYSESGIIYDLNGNIKNYTRRGLLSPGVYGVIDQLTYTYGDALRPDRLTQMADAGSATKGFVYNAAAAAYQYDLNGNMTLDNHKGFSLSYNYLNLPQSFTKGANVITVTYTADGEKLSKALTGGGATKNYVSGIEYSGANLEAIYFSEGRCTPNGATAFFYQYTIRDHLGNARANFQADGASMINIEDMHYYPFGLLMEGLAGSSASNKYMFNKIERNEEFGLNLDLAFFRSFDPAIGRWWQVDPKPSFLFSPYSFVSDNPLKFFDTLGDTLRGVDERSAQRAQSIIQGSFKKMGMAGDAAAQLFTLGNDGITFNSISRKDFKRATSSLNKEGKALARGYMKAINGKETNTVEVVKRSEMLSKTSVEALSSRGDRTSKSGSDIDQEHHGGFTGNNGWDGKMVQGAPGVHVILVMDSEAKVSYSDGIRRASEPGEIMAHELIGHGLGGSIMLNDGKDEAIQAGNMYLRAIGKQYFRPDHMVSPNDPKTNPRGIPTFLIPEINPIDD